MKVSGTKKLKPVWLTTKCVRLLDKKRKTFVKYTDKDHPACVKANKLASREIRKARKDFERKLATDIKFGKKSFFAYAKSKAKCTVSAGPLIDSAGNISQTPEENIEEFNGFFASVFTKENT